MIKEPQLQPLRPWRPHTYIGEDGTVMPLGNLRAVGIQKFQSLMDTGKITGKHSAENLSALAFYYRHVAIETTALIVNLMTR
jgi:hypothetical protein